MTTESVDFNQTEIEVPETDDGSNYCSHNNFRRVQMTPNLGQSSKHEANLPNNNAKSMEIVLEEGREAAKEHLAQDPAIKLVFQSANADKTGKQTSLGKLNLKKTAAIAAGEDARALWCVWKQLELAEWVLYRKWLIEGTDSNVRQFVVPKSVRKKVLEQQHESKISGGHFAFQKTLDRSRQRLWWPNMSKDIERKCENSLTSQSQSTARKKLKAPLQKINVGIRFNKIAADILGPVTKKKIGGYKYIIVLTDYFTKIVVSTPLQNTTVEAVARAILEKWILLFGAPDSIHTDWGSNFCSELILELCKLFGIEKTKTSPYHPQGNGMVERHNQVIADAISKYRAGNPNTWDEMLPYLSFVYNTTVHKKTVHTLFSLVYGQECKYPIDLLLPRTPGHEIQSYEFTRWLEEQFLEAHMNARETLGCNQERQKDRYHKEVFGESYRKGDQIWLFAPHKANSRKLFLPWDGPYVVLEKISDVLYKISKTGSSNKWQIVHYSRLKPVKEEPNQRRIFSRPSTGRRQPTGEAVEDLEETAGLGLFTEKTTRRLSSKHGKSSKDLEIQMDGGRRWSLPHSVCGTAENFCD